MSITSNLSTIQATIQALGYTADTSVQQIKFINSEYHNICGKERWPFLEAIDTTAVVPVAGVPNYTFTPVAGNTWRNLDAVRMTVPATNDGGVGLEYRDPQELMEHLSKDSENATPIEWTMYAGQLWFYPTPDQTYQCSVFYIQEESDLINPTDVPLIPLPYHDVLVWGAIERQAFRERDWLGRQFAQTEKELLLGRLEREYRMRQRQTSSEVKRSGWWSTQVIAPVSSTGF